MAMFKHTLLITFVVSSMAFAQSEEPKITAETSYRVIKLQYATAEELARVLAAVAPPGVKIIAYPPTNSLIITGHPRIIGEQGRKGTTDEP